MDRIDTSLLSTLTLKPAARPVGPRAIDPTPRLRMVDRRDTVEIGGQAVDRAAASNPLVAGTVTNAPAIAPAMPATPAAKSVAASAAMRMYASPADQNAAATRIASNATGSTLDITA